MPNPYAILAALGVSIALIIGAFFYGEHISSLSWKSATAKLEATAAQTLADANAKSAAKDAANAELSRNLDETHAKAIADIDSTRADFASRLRDAQRRQSCPRQLPSAAAAAGVPASPATGSDAGRGCFDPVAVQHVRDAMKKLQADVLGAVSWANQVGR